MEEESRARIFFRRRASNYRKMVEEKIKEEMTDVSVEKEPPLLNQSSYVFRPDFVFERGGKTFIVEAKDQVKPKDVALFEGMVRGLDAKPIIISYVNPDANTSLFAEELNIKLIAGSPHEAVSKLKGIISAP